MTFRGTLSKGIIVLNQPPPWPEGTRVEVIVPDAEEKKPTLSEKLLRHAGTVPDLPSDMAEQHDHYIRGSSPTAACKVVFGTVARGILLTVHRRTHAGAEDYWDGNWLSTDIRATICGFNVRVDADLRVDEFEAFRSEVSELHSGARRDAKLETMEGWISMHLTLTDRLGHICCTGTILDEPGIGNHLEFSLDIDQSYLPQLVRELDEVLVNFPIVGAP